jgi:hypothetical protein
MGDACLDCDHRCKWCEITSTTCIKCDLEQERILQGSECICREEFTEIDGVCVYDQEEKWQQMK